jgi:hypothetical protein
MPLFVYDLDLFADYFYRKAIDRHACRAEGLTEADARCCFSPSPVGVWD